MNPHDKEYNPFNQEVLISIGSSKIGGAIFPLSLRYGNDEPLALKLRTDRELAARETSTPEVAADMSAQVEFPIIGVAPRSRDEDEGPSFADADSDESREAPDAQSQVTRIQDQIDTLKKALAAGNLADPIAVLQEVRRLMQSYTHKLTEEQFQALFKILATVYSRMGFPGAEERYRTEASEVPASSTDTPGDEQKAEHEQGKAPESSVPRAEARDESLLTLLKAYRKAREQFLEVQLKLLARADVHNCIDGPLGHLRVAGSDPELLKWALRLK